MEINFYQDTLNKQGLNWGVTLISATILVPIATGDIVLKDLFEHLKITVGLGCNTLWRFGCGLISKRGWID